MYNHCNLCNIPIYFCNIVIKHLQHTSETSKTLKTYACNMRYQHNVTLLLGRIEASRLAELDAGAEIDIGAE